MSNVIKKEIGIQDYIEVIINESIAFFNKKYEINSYNFLFDKKTYWELQKPRFYFDMYPESKIDNTIWVMEFFYFKIRRIS